MSGKARSKSIAHHSLQPSSPAQKFEPLPSSAHRPVASPASDKNYSPARASLVADLSVPVQNKVNVQISKVDREFDRLNRILQIERQRAEIARSKVHKLEQQS